MLSAIRGLAIVAGLAEWRPPAGRTADLVAASKLPAEWLPPTPPPRAFDDTLADGGLTAGMVAGLELAHEEYGPPPPTWRQAAALAAWRARMNAWLDAEWLAWRELLHTYPAPEAS